MNQDPLHLFTLMPPAIITSKIEALRREVSENFQCYRALKPPVHISLFTIFNASPEDDDVLETMSRWASQQSRMTIQLRDFGFFERPKTPVFYIHVEKSNELRRFNTGVITQVKKLLPQLNEIKPQTYHPHITLAYRDTTSEMLPAVKAAYRLRTFSETFEAKSLYLWRHNGKYWDVIQDFPLATMADGSPEGSQGALF